MAKNAVIQKPKAETYRGEAGPCGIEVNTRRHDGGKLDKGLGKIAINLVGGLGDAGTVSLEDTAQELYEIGRGDFVVSTFGTNYPKKLIKLVRGLSTSREARSKRAYKGIRHVNERYEPRVALAVGQSEGGITGLDGTHHWARKSSGLYIPAKTGVYTLDSPMRHVETPEDPSVPEALARLGLHCVPDLVATNLRQRAAMVAGLIRHVPSPWDLAYMIAETGYLKGDYDMDPIAKELVEERGIQLWHGVHDQDWVQNTTTPHGTAKVFRGGHLRFAWDTEPVVTHISEVALELASQVSLAQNGVLGVAA